MQKCPPFCLNTVHYAYFLIQKIYTITFIVFHYGYSWFCKLPFIIIQFPFFPWNWLHTVNKDSVKDILIKKLMTQLKSLKKDVSFTSSTSELSTFITYLFSKPYDLWDMRKYLFQSCRNNIESIKDTDTYMRDTALLLIEPVTLI